MQILLIIHSILRWLVIVVAIVAAVKFALGWLRGSAFKRIDRSLASGFSGLMDLQALLGFILLISNGKGFPSFRIEHAIIMIIAAAVAHLHVLWKNSDDKLRFRNSLFIVVDVVIIIFFGVARMPGN